MKRLFAVLVAIGLVGCASSAHNAPPPQVGLSRAQESARIHTELAAAYFSRGQMAVALEELSKAVKAEPDYAMAYNVRALVRMALRENEQAEEDFQHSLRLDPNNSEALNNYGWFLCQNGKERNANRYFMAAVKNPLYTTPEKPYLNAGICARKAGAAKDAETYLQRALVMKPEMPEALYALADMSLSAADVAGAKSYFLRYERTQMAGGLSAEALWLAVRIERALGNRESAENYAGQLSKRFPDARETQLMLYGK